ncbi:MAG: IS21-like element helper ATPase IstB [Flavobacteriales bacterium]|nr:IS21-like element helper ATPase IstB [Flavobacteriales bacterium]
MNEVTLEKMKQMKFYGMHNAFKTAIETGRTDGYTIDEFISLLIDSEHDDRQTRKINRHITNARFRYSAELEKVSYSEERNLHKNKVMRLADCSYIKKGENILITGSTGVGKSFLASALGHHACSMGYRVLYFNTSKMFAKMKMAKVDASYIKSTAHVERQNLVILDDFGLQPMDNQSRMILMDIVEDRHEKSSMIITSQLPVDSWYDVIGEKTMADAIMDRIVHNSHRIDLKGESMRRTKPKNNPQENIKINN